MSISRSHLDPRQAPAISPGPERTSSSAARVLDWTNLDAVPASIDIGRLAVPGNNGPARLAILVNSPRMLRAADVFAEQAGLQGAQVRVFVDSSEAFTWLHKARH